MCASGRNHRCCSIYLLLGSGLGLAAPLRARYKGDGGETKMSRNPGNKRRSPTGAMAPTATGTLLRHRTSREAYVLVLRSCVFLASSKRLPGVALLIWSGLRGRISAVFWRGWICVCGLCAFLHHVSTCGKVSRLREWVGSREVDPRICCYLVNNAARVQQTKHIYAIAQSSLLGQSILIVIPSTILLSKKIHHSVQSHN